MGIIIENRKLFEAEEKRNHTNIHNKERSKIDRKNKVRICPQCKCRELDKYQQMCSECREINRLIGIDIKTSGQKHKDYMRNYMRKWLPEYYQKHPEKKEKVLKKARDLYASDDSHREKVKLQTQKWIENNPERYITNYKKASKRHKERYANDPEYREKIKKRNRDRYHTKKAQNEKDSNRTDERTQQVSLRTENI